MRWILIVALLSPISSIAAKEPPPEAKAHFEAGDKAYKLGDFATAVEEYSKSYQLFPVPLLLYDLAQAYRQLGNNEKALFSYKQYLAEAPAGKYRPIAEQKVAELEKLVEDQRKSKLAPPSGPAGLEKEPVATVSPAPVPAAAVEAPTQTVEQPRPKTLLYVAIAVAAVVVVGAAIGIGVAVSSGGSPPPMTTLGNYGVFP